tara:strand:+ start:700 stop:2001 length:1302 start_codon:yes stop_codon:yes gene_type:complete
MPDQNYDYDFTMPVSTGSGPDYDDLFDAFTGTPAQLDTFIDEYFPELSDYTDYLTAPDLSGATFAGIKREQGVRDLQDTYAKGSREMGKNISKSMDQYSSGISQTNMATHGGLDYTKQSMLDMVGSSANQMFTQYEKGIAGTEAEYQMGLYQAERGAMDDFYDNVMQIAQYDISADAADNDSCFIAGTKVLMSDDSLKNIEDIKVGESVKGASGDNEVLALDRTKLGKRRLYSINGGNYFVTEEHPFMTKEGWKSINPKATLKENHVAFSDESSIGTLDVGDILITSSDQVKIESISLKSGDPEMQLYNFALSGDHTYNADGYLVHNKCCFIVLEVEEKKGLNEDVRKYRDKMMDDENRSGYYKLAQVVVPLMRKYKVVKWFFKYLFVNPAKSWAKWYYHKKGIGWIFEPLRKFWLGTFSYLGKNHKMKKDNE